jgi:hypothetical protein
MTQSNFALHKYFRFAAVLAAVLLLVSCNRHRLFETKPEITIYQTSQQPDILPALAVLDLQSDSENARKLIEKRNSLEMGIATDSITINIENYLLNGEKNSLFKLLSPNVNTRRWGKPKPLYIKSSFLGFSNPADTIAVNHMLNDSGLLLYGSHIAWANCKNNETENELGLAVIPPGAKQLRLSDKDVKQIRVVQERLNHSWKWFERLTGQARYSIIVTLQPDAIEKVESEFPDDSALLIQCRFNDKEVYCSTISEQIADGFTLVSNAAIK